MSNKYLGHEKGLIGPVTMEKPMKNFLDTDAEFLIRKHKYHQHLSLLPIIPCEGWVPEVGKEYHEWEHFELKWQVNHDGKWYNTIEPPKHLSANKEKYRFVAISTVAVPITKGEAVPLPAANNSGDGKEFVEPPPDFTYWVVVNKWEYDETDHRWVNNYIGEVKGIRLKHAELYQEWKQSQSKTK